MDKAPANLFACVRLRDATLHLVTLQTALPVPGAGIKSPKDANADMGASKAVPTEAARSDRCMQQAGAAHAAARRPFLEFP